MVDHPQEQLLVQCCRSLCQMSEVSQSKDDAAANDQQRIGPMRESASLLAQRCSTSPKSESVLAFWKQLDERSTNLLQNLLGAMERCEDGQLAVDLVRLLDLFVRRSAKGRKKRIRLVVSLNGVSSILKCLLTFCQRESSTLETIEPLVYLVLLFGGVDKKFPVKVRLTGTLKAAAEFCRNHDPPSLSILDLLIAAAQSPPNALALGKNKETIPYLFSVVRSMAANANADAELCRRAVELVYYLAKIRRIRVKLMAENGIEVMLQLFKRYFPLIDEDEGCAMKMCLITLGTLRLLTRTQSGQQALLDLEGLQVFRDAVRTCLEHFDRRGQESVTKQLHSAICAVCLRCLPSKQPPDGIFENHPVQFELPAEAEREPAEDRSDSEQENNEAGASEGDEEIVKNSEHPLQKRVRRQRSDLEEEYAKYCKEFNLAATNSTTTSNLQLSRPLRPILSFDDHSAIVDCELARKSCSPGSPSVSAGASSSISPTKQRSIVKKGDGSRGRRRRSLSVDDSVYYIRQVRHNRRSIVRPPPPARLAPLVNYSGLRRSSLEESTTGGTSKTSMMKSIEYHSDEFVKHAAQTKSAVPFLKIAYPEFVGGYPNLPLQPLVDYSVALLERVLEEVECVISPKQFQTRTVFDLTDAMTKNPREGPLTNDDKARIGKPDSNCDHLKFESRFESGNLRRVVQVGPYEYELFLNSDVNQLQQHHQWFYFEVSNVQADVPYTFTIANCVKSQSLFQTGMQPVVFSVSEAVGGRPGWARCGRTVVYYKNRYVRPAGNKKPNEARTFYSASFTVAFRHAYDVCYFAYHYPYTYSMLRTHLSKLQESLINRRDICVRRDTLCHTLGSNPVDVMTITANGKPNAVAKRDCVVLSARVHPGESNASWMMHGTIDFLLSDNAKAKECREKYVFTLVPMLNPDGVINGNYRCSLAGQDLNRQWATPSPVIHPTIYHLKGLLQHLHAINKAPFVYCDYHGHSRKKNIFVYGNNPQLSWWPPDHASLHNYEFYTLPEILDASAPGFWLKYSSFAVQKAKEASARVVVWREMGVSRSYTMEASCGGFDRGPYQGYQIGTQQCIEMGQKFCEALCPLKDYVDAKRLPSRKFEESDEDSVALPSLTVYPGISVDNPNNTTSAVTSSLR